MNKKRYLLGLIIILFITSVTSALAAVTITPSSPTASDDLTCRVNGGICNSASLCTPHWTGNSFSGEKFSNPLPHKFISAGDKIKCEAWASAPMGDYLIGSASVTISTPPVNTPPSIFGRIPDYNILRNSGLNDDLVPLWNFASDAETPTNRLIFTITRQTNTPIVNCVIDNQTNRTINPGVFVDCTAQLNQVGYSDITVRVMDAGGLWTEDIFRVSVIGAGNTPPTIALLPDVTIAEDSGLNINLIDLWNYAYDAETSDDQLIFTITSETGLTITDCSVRNNRYVECLTLPNQNGISDVTVMIQDQGGLVASDTFRVTVTPVNDAPVVNNIPDVTMYEDLPNSADPQIDLDNYASDPDGDIITWSASSSTPNLAVVINLDNTVTFNPVLNWFGSATVIFTATDPGGLTGSDSISVIVYPVNDIPIILGIPNQTFLEDFGTANNAVDLWNYASDVETPTNQLTFSILSQLAPGIVDCRLDSNRYIDCTSQKDQNGFSDVIVQVSDSQGGTDTAEFRITITPVNDAPTINPLIPDQTRDEDSNPWSLDLTNYGHDAEDAQTALRWSVTGVNAALFSTSFDANNRIITFTPIANACGSDVITLTVTDLQGLTASQDITFNLNCVNDLPWINPVIPDQVRDEDSLPWSLDLTSYGNDIETAQTALIWSASGVDTNLFNASFDANNRVITFTPVANAFGTDVITLTVTDSDGASVSQNIRVTLNSINDIPWINPVIPNQVRDEGSLPWGLDLSLYENDVEDNGADLIWNVSGVNTNLFSVSIDPITHVATFILFNGDVFGSDSITFTLTDSEGASVSQNVLVTINPINDAPVVSDIPNVNFNEDTTTTIDLNNYVSDVDNTIGQLVWSVSGNTNIIVNIAGGVATLSAPANWFGQEAIVFRATDPGALYDEDEVIVNVLAVNDAPIVTPFAVLNINEDSTNSINLNDYVSDVDNLDSEIIWTFSGNNNINVILTPEKIAVFVPAANWFGSETITFTARDPGGLSDSEILTVNVNAVNDAPVVGDIPNVNFNEDGTLTTSWNLNDYVSDVDNTDGQITWSVLGNTNVNFVINPDRTITFSAAADWNGAEIITFRATDPGGLYDEDTVTVSVGPINDAPIVSGIPDVIIPEDGVDFSIDLDNYVSDVDNLDNEMSWTYSGNTNIIVNVDPVSHIVVLTPLPNWFGVETITFRACDPNNLCSIDSSVVTVTSVNDAPVVSNIPDISFNEDSSTTVDLNNYVSDIDNLDSQISWSVSGNTNIIVGIAGGIATLSAPANWNGFETLTFRACDPSVSCASDSSIVLVNAINDAPTISPIIPDQVRLESAPPWTLDLTSYGHDIENAQTSLIWSVSGINNTIYSATFDAAQRVITFTPVAGACGPDVITLSVTDLEGASASQNINVVLTCVNGAPVVSNIPNIQISEDSAPVTLIQLDNFVSDSDNTPSEMTWTYSPVPANIGISINSTTHEVTFSILTPNWFGQRTVTFTATDPGGLSASDDVTIIVLPVNDLPVITSSSPASPISINEGSSQLFSVTATDIDGPSPLSYYWQRDGVNITGAITSSYTYNATNGPAAHTLTAIVSDGIATVNQLWNINEINVAPVVSANGPYYCPIGKVITLSASASEPAGSADILTYSWDLDDDGVYDDASGQSVPFVCTSMGTVDVDVSVNDGTVSVSAGSSVNIYYVTINEFSAEHSAGVDWVEIYNNDAANSVAINNWRIEDASANTVTFSGTINANGFFVVAFSNRLNVGGDTIKLYDNLGNLLDSYTYGPQIIDISEGRIPDGIGGFVPNVLTPNAANIPLGSNLPPVANASVDQTVLVGSLVTLDGSGSSDPNVGDVITYLWTINSAPAGSSAVIINNLTVNPTFTPDIAGTYVIELRVTDDGTPNLYDLDTMIITASTTPVNNPPQIDSINLIPVTVGIDDTLGCVVSASDPDGDPITISYVWATTGGQNLSGFTTSILDLNLVAGEANGDVITCTATPNDGTVDGASASDTATVSAVVPPGNNAPVAGILNPGNNSIFTQGSSVNFIGTGFDPENGTLSGAALQWSSSIDGTIGTGQSFSTTSLSLGTHLINLTVCDLALPSLCDSTTITITINPSSGNTAPIITGIPDQNLALGSGLNDNIIDLWNYAVDAETVDSALIFSITSQTAAGIVNCIIDSSRYIDCTTVAGTGISDVTVQVQDAGGLTASDIFRVNITSGNLNPTVTITNPMTGSTFVSGAAVNFIGTASDPEDGDLTSSISWSSSIDGNLGSGSPLSLTSLSVGTHTITAQVTDSGSLVDTDSIIITIVSLTGQTIINSTINGHSYPLNFTVDVSSAGDGNVNNSTVIDSIINSIANAINSYIDNSNIVAGSVIDNCVILSSTFSGTCTDSIIDPSSIVNSKVDSNSDVKDSTIINSVITNSIINNSVIKNTTVINSQIYYYTIENANVTNNVVCNGIVNGISVTLCHTITEFKNLAPTAVINANPISGTDSVSVSFSATGSSDPNVGGVLSDILTYSWNFGDGNSGSGLTTTHVYSVGTYTAVLTVTDKFGLSDSDSATITVVSSSSGGSSGGGGNGGGGSDGCSTNLRVLEGTTSFTARQGCVISFTYDNIRYESKLVTVTPNDISLTLLGNQENVLLSKQGRLPLTAAKDLVFSYDKLDYGKVTMIFSIEEKQTVITPQKPSQTETIETTENSNQETTELVSKESTTPTGAVIAFDVKKNLLGFAIMIGIILVGYVIYYVFGKKNY